MKVKFRELKQLLEILVDNAEISGFADIDIDIDNYWFIASDEREKFNSDISELCVGSIKDDLTCLRKVLSNENKPTPVDFERLGNILITVAEKISQSDKIY
jgi:hypothetical protein